MDRHGGLRLNYASLLLKLGGIRCAPKPLYYKGCCLSQTARKGSQKRYVVSIFWSNRRSTRVTMALRTDGASVIPVVSMKLPDKVDAPPAWARALNTFV